jgi:hypothetical protein
MSGVTSTNRGNPRLYEEDNMSLGTLDQLHVYVKHVIELMAEICG